jgi:hypothetical protein
MDQFEQDYRNERRKALRDSVKSGKTSLPVGILQHGANRIGEGVSDTVQGIGAFAKSLYNNPQAAVESGAEGLEALYNSVAQEDPMAAMQVAQMVASGGTGAAILRGGRIDPSAVGSGGGNILRGFHSTQKDFDEIDPERGLPTGNFGQAAYFSESNDYPSRLNPNSRIIEADLDTTNFLQAGKKIPVAKERVLGTLSVLNSLEDATGKPFKVEYDADTNTALVEYNRRRRAGEEGPIKETKTFDFNNSSKLFDDIKSVTWGLRYESMSTDRTNLSDFMKAAGFTGVKGGSDDDFHIGVFDKSAVKQFAQGGPVMRGIGTLNETARNMFRGPRGVGAYQQFASGGEAMGPPPTRGPDPQGIGYFQQFADGGPVYMKEGGEVITPDDIAGMREKIMNDYGFDPEDVAVQEGVPPELFLRLLFKENRGRQGPKSPKGAIGLAQLMPATAKELGVDPTVPYENAVGGARYLKQKIAEFDGDVLLGLAAYNAGAGNVRKYEGVPPFAETQDYVAVILGEGYSGGTSLSETIRKEQGFAPYMSYEGQENDVREEQGLVPISMASSGTSEGVGSLMRQETSAPETSLRPVLRPTAPSTSLRPVLRPEETSAPETSLRPVLRGQDQTLREKYAPENFERNLLSPDAFQYLNGLGVMEREGKKQGIETLDPRGIRRINNFAMERSTMA